MQAINFTPGTLDPMAIRHIVREAETGMADGVNPKTLLVKATLDHLASRAATDIANQILMDQGTKQMLGDPPATHYDIPGIPRIMQADIDAKTLPAVAYAAAQEAVKTLAPKLAAHNGRWLAKYGIVDEHVKSMGSPSAPEIVDHDPLGIGQTEADLPPPPAAAAGTIDLDFLLGTDAPAASVVPPPATPSTVGEADLHEAFGLLREVGEVDVPALSERLAQHGPMSKSTLSNYLAGRTQKPKCTLGQSRVLIAHIDVQIAKLQRAATIFAAIQN